MTKLDDRSPWLDHTPTLLPGTSSADDHRFSTPPTSPPRSASATATAAGGAGSKTPPLGQHRFRSLSTIPTSRDGDRASQAYPPTASLTVEEGAASRTGHHPPSFSVSSPPEEATSSSRRRSEAESRGTDRPFEDFLLYSPPQPERRPGAHKADPPASVPATSPITTAPSRRRVSIGAGSKDADISRWAEGIVPSSTPDGSPDTIQRRSETRPASTDPLRRDRPIFFENTRSSTGATSRMRGGSGPAPPTSTHASLAAVGATESLPSSPLRCQESQLSTLPPSPPDSVTTEVPPSATFERAASRSTVPISGLHAAPETSARERSTTDSGGVDFERRFPPPSSVHSPSMYSEDAAPDSAIPPPRDDRREWTIDSKTAFTDPPVFPRGGAAAKRPRRQGPFPAPVLSSEERAARRALRKTGRSPEHHLPLHATKAEQRKRAWLERQAVRRQPWPLPFARAPADFDRLQFEEERERLLRMLSTNGRDDLSGDALEYLEVADVPVLNALSALHLRTSIPAAREAGLYYLQFSLGLGMSFPPERWRPTC